MPLIADTQRRVDLLIEIRRSFPLSERAQLLYHQRFIVLSDTRTKSSEGTRCLCEPQTPQLSVHEHIDYWEVVSKHLEVTSRRPWADLLWFRDFQHRQIDSLTQSVHFYGLCAVAQLIIFWVGVVWATCIALKTAAEYCEKNITIEFFVELNYSLV